MDNNYYVEKIRKRRRLKFGALAVGLTSAVVALVIIINAVFSALASKFMWYVDMTEEAIYGITDTSIDLLDDYRGTSAFSISIVFCQSADQLDANYNTKLVHNIAKQFEKEFDFINIEYVDLINHPEAVDKYQVTTVSTPSTDSIYIVKHDLTLPEEEMKQSKVFTARSFYTFDSDTGDVFAFNGEYRITSTVLQLVGDSPIAYFVTGHGEQTENTTMWELFEDAGYRVEEIDLTKETPSSDAKIMVINCPRYDYLGANDSVNEIKKIDNFLEQSFGGLMVFFDENSRELKELEAFLEEWGIAFGDSKIRDYDNSLSVDGSELVAEYTTTGSGSDLTKAIRQLNSIPKTIVDNARPIELLYDRAEIGAGVRMTSAVLTTSSSGSAEALSLTNGEATPVKGVYNLMTVTVDSKYIDSEGHYSYVLAAGSSSFADDKYINGARYGNRDIIFSAMKSFSKKTVPLGLDFKVFDDEALDITTKEANILTAVCTLLPPVLVFGLGAFVYLRRRYL